MLFEAKRTPSQYLAEQQISANVRTAWGKSHSFPAAYIHQRELGSAMRSTWANRGWGDYVARRYRLAERASERAPMAGWHTSANTSLSCRVLPSPGGDPVAKQLSEPRALCGSKGKIGRFPLHNTAFVKLHELNNSWLLLDCCEDG
jgi:hypothetical protein